MDDYRNFLMERGAAQADHLHGTLLEHLQGTYRLLLVWGCERHVCLGGLFHSIYGTSIYTHRSVDLTERPLIKRLIGERGEMLAFLFCAADRPRAWLDALSTGELDDRTQGSVHCLGKGVLDELLEIECANLLDQSTGWRFVQRLLELHAVGTLTMRPTIVMALRDGLDANRTAFAR